MPVDLNAAIAALVAAEVKAILDPYMSTLDRVAAFVGGQPARRGPGRPRKSAGLKAKPSRRRARRGSKAKRAARLLKKFSEGQKVTYKQGKGTFEAKVTAINVEAGTLKLERSKDGKRVTRPVAKVIAA